MKYRILFLSFLVGLQARAQTTSDTLRQIELPAATITSNRVSLLSEQHRLSVPVREIQKQLVFQDLPYLLNGLSSVVVTSDAGTGTGYTGIRIRGADLSRIQVTMNGVPVNDPESQNTFFVDMPDLLASTQDLQISKGASQSRPGAGNFGAGISINNLDVNQTKAFMQLSADYGSFHTARILLRAGTGWIQDRFNLSVRMNSLRSNGYIERSGADLKGMQLSARYKTKRNAKITFNYLNGYERTGQAWNGVPEDSLSTNRRFNELGLRSDGSYYPNQTDNYGQQYYQLFIDKPLPKNLHFSSTLFYTRGKGYYEEYKQAQPYAQYGLPEPVFGQDTLFQTDMVRQLWLDNHYLGARASLNYLGRDFDAGVYLNYNHYIGDHYGFVTWAAAGVPDNHRWYLLDALKREANTYAMIDWRFARNWSLLGDLQVRQVFYTLNGFRNNPAINHQLDFVFVNPKARLTYQTNKSQWVFSAGIAQKEPNRDDVEAGAQQLPKPEKLYNAEVSYSRILWSQSVLHLNAFYMYYRDQLVSSGRINDVGAYTRVNVPESFRRGIEMDLHWKLWRSRLEIRANLALSQNKITRFTAYLDNYDTGVQEATQFTGTDISFSPASIAGFQLGILPFKESTRWYHEWGIDLFQKYVGKQYLDNTANANRQMPAFYFTDAMLRCPIKLSGFRVIWRAGVYNVFNQQYVANGYTFSYRLNQTTYTQNYFFPQSTRRFSIGLQLEL